MDDITPDRFRELIKQVRRLERKVEDQQHQIAKLKRRTSAESSSSSTSSDGELVEVPRQSNELEILDILHSYSAGKEEVLVDDIKNEAAERGYLRTRTKNVVKKWLNEGYLIGDPDDTVRVSEWPPEMIEPTE